jgi:hypothetical protein
MHDPAPKPAAAASAVAVKSMLEPAAAALLEVSVMVTALPLKVS